MSVFSGIDGGSFMTGLLLGFTLCAFALAIAIKYWPDMGSDN